MSKDSILKHFAIKAENYTSLSHGFLWNWLRQIESKELLSGLELKPNSRCVDLGCGTGYYAKKIFERFDCLPVCVDQSQEMLEKLVLPEAIKICTPLEEFETQSKFDFIICAGALEFTPKPDLALKKIEGLLTEQGSARLLIPRPSFWGYYYQNSYRKKNISITLFSKDQLIDLVQTSGLKIIQMQSVFPFNTFLEVKK